MAKEKGIELIVAFEKACHEYLMAKERCVTCEKLLEEARKCLIFAFRDDIDIIGAPETIPIQWKADRQKKKRKASPAMIKALEKARKARSKKCKARRAKMKKKRK